MIDSVVATGGARFFDENKADRGWASAVIRRAPTIGGLTALDVISAEPQLASFLKGLDKARLRIQHAGEAGDSYMFQWASGYDNGPQIKVQGVLEAGSAATAQPRFVT